jgi:hypothetical protein
LLASAVAPAQDQTEPTAPIRRVVVIGASASAGFGVIADVTKEDGRIRKEPVDLARSLKAAAPEKSLVVLNLASGAFFMDPVRMGTAGAKRTRDWKPEFTIAIDYLFWFLYGTQEESDRLARLEEGLALIGSVDSPLILGDMPDMSRAVGRILRASQCPTPETIAAANKRIYAWADERPNVAIVSLSNLLETLASEQPFSIGDHAWDPKADGLPMILLDQLHPTLNGQIALLQAVDQAIRSMSDIGRRFPPLQVDRRKLTARITRPIEAP